MGASQLYCDHVRAGGAARSTRCFFLALFSPPCRLLFVYQVRSVHGRACLTRDITARIIVPHKLCFALFGVHVHECSARMQCSMQCVHTNKNSRKTYMVCVTVATKLARWNARLHNKVTAYHNTSYNNYIFRGIYA